MALTGKQIGKLRRARKWTVKRLATAAGVTPMQIWRIETGKQKASLEVLQRILRALEMRAVAEEVINYLRKEK